MTMITPSYLGETIEYSSLHACRSTLEDPTPVAAAADEPVGYRRYVMPQSAAAAPVEGDETFNAYNDYLARLAAKDAEPTAGRLPG